MIEELRRYPCPDCGAEFQDRELAHDPTCPIGVSLDESTEADRKYFIEHPWATEYWRELAPCDWDNVRRSLPEELDHVISELRGMVRIVQIEPGLRYRDFNRIWGILDISKTPQ